MGSCFGRLTVLGARFAMMPSTNLLPRTLALVPVSRRKTYPSGPGVVQMRPGGQAVAARVGYALRLRCSSHAFGVLLLGTHDAAGFPIAAPQRLVVPCRSRDHARH